MLARSTSCTLYIIERTFAAAFSAFFFAAASAFNSFLSAFLDKGWPFSSSLTSATAAVADSTPLLLSSVILFCYWFCALWWLFGCCHLRFLHVELQASSNSQLPNSIFRVNWVHITAADARFLLKTIPSSRCSRVCFYLPSYFLPSPLLCTRSQPRSVIRRRLCLGDKLIHQQFAHVQLLHN